MFQFCCFFILFCLVLLLLFVVFIVYVKDDYWIFEFVVGGGVVLCYSGSEEYCVMFLLFFDVILLGGWFLGISGIGWGIFFGEYICVCVYVGVSGICKDKDLLFGGLDFLCGMGDIDFCVLVGVLVGYMLGEVVLSGFWQFICKDEDKVENGLVIQQLYLNLSMLLFDLVGGVVSGSVFIDYGNCGYMQIWYGVSLEQVVCIGFVEYRLKVGLVSVGVGLKWSYCVGCNGNWYILVEGMCLFGDVVDSLIVQKVNQFGVMSGYMYCF